jgi:hypothetical protein
MRTLYPESNQAPRDMTWLERARRESSPGLVDAVVKELGASARATTDPVSAIALRRPWRRTSSGR